VGGWENGRRETAESWDEGKTGEQGRGKIPAWECGELAREEGAKEIEGRKMGGRGRKRMGGAGQLGATRHTPIPNVAYAATSQYGDVWQCATLANAGVALCHVTKWWKFFFKYA
jgi:hypothetical protein